MSYELNLSVTNLKLLINNAKPVKNPKLTDSKWTTFYTWSFNLMYGQIVT